MTLSLDDVKNKRFRMARKSGYEVLEVDEFVDEIEEAFAQLVEENEGLKKQVESLRTSPDGSVSRPAAAPAQATPAQATAAPAPGQPQTVVVTTAKEASSAVVRLVELSTEQAERLLAEAAQEADRIREQASSQANQVTGDARSRAERLESEARRNAERVQAETLSRTQQLDREIDARRAEMLGHLQTQREELSSSVRQLRAFEAAYRSNMTEHLRSQITLIESNKAEPTPAPDLAAPARPSSTKAEPAKSTSDDDTQRVERVSADEPAPGGAGARGATPKVDALVRDKR